MNRDKKRSLPDFLEEAEIIAGALLFGGIIILLISCGEYPWRLAGNGRLLLCALPFWLIVGILYLFREKHGKKSVVRHPVTWLFLLYLGIFVLQLLLVSRVYFYMGWDAGMLKYRVESVVNGGEMADTSADVGYSTMPNNLLLFHIFFLIEKAGQLFSMEEPYHLCIYISCFCVCAACFLGHLILRRLVSSAVFQGVYLMFALPMILFSPWIMVPYSDTYGMFFATLGMWGLLCLDRKYLKWAVTAFASVIGYQVKPSCVFPLFAAYMVYGVRFLASLKSRWKELCALILCTAAFWGIGLCIPLWIQQAHHFRLMPELELTYTHYLMMGIHPETNGIFNDDDYLLSIGCPDVETRERVNLEVFRDRWNAMRAEKTLWRFCRTKAVINYNDGTFSWGDQGPGFFAGYVEHDNAAAKWFKDIMVPPDAADFWKVPGKFYYLYRTFMQILWMSVLLGVVLAAAGRRENGTEKACMMIVLCGLTAFVMLFEARARYLFLYTPVFLSLSMCGYEAVCRRAGGLLSLKEKRVWLKRSEGESEKA